MKRRALIILLSSVGVVCLSALAGDEEAPRTPATEKALYWTDTNRSVSVFLVERETDFPRRPKNFSLFVAGGDDLAVVYRSRRNSSIPVVRELKPEPNSSIKGMREFEFRHKFSRTTIWMAIVFKKNDRRIEELTRTFNGSMDKVVANKQFLETPDTERPQQEDARNLK